MSRLGAWGDGAVPALPLPRGWGRSGRRGGGAHPCVRFYFPGHPPQSPGLLQTRRASETRLRTLVTRDSEGRAIPRGVGAERGPATTSTRRGGGSREQGLSPVPVSPVLAGQGQREGPGHSGALQGRGQAVPGWQDRGSVLLLSWLHPLEQAGCRGLCALPRDTGGSHGQCPPCPEATRRCVPGCASPARCQHSLTRVSVCPEPLAGALPCSLSTLWVTFCCSQPLARRVPTTAPASEGVPAQGSNCG